MTFHKFYRAHYRNRAPLDQRPGQWFFNDLCAVRPDLADAIRGGKLDPFHGRVSLALLDWLEANWGRDVTP